MRLSAAHKAELNIEIKLCGAENLQPRITTFATGNAVTVTRFPKSKRAHTSVLFMLPVDTPRFELDNLKSEIVAYLTSKEGTL